jgi:tight adherence protein C
MMLLIIAFLATFGVVLCAGLLLFNRDVVLDRLSLIVGQRSASSANLLTRIAQKKPASVGQITKPFQNILPRSPAEVSVLQKRLIRAGYRKDSAVNNFYGAKVLAPLALTLLATATGAYQFGVLFVYGLSVGLGFLLPDFWLGNRIAKRQLALRLGLPEALDLMVICSEAGLGIEQTIQRVALELKESQPEIREEFNLINLEQKAGLPREEALKNFAERTDVDSIRAFAGTLIQSDAFGTSIAKTLRVYSDTLRTQRRQKAEEQAAKTTVKLVFPLVIFIFPSIFVVALGPAMIKMLEGFAEYF